MRQLREQVYSLSERVSHLGERVSALEAWRDNVKARHASTPAWIFGIIAAIISDRLQAQGDIALDAGRIPALGRTGDPSL